MKNFNLKFVFICVAISVLFASSSLIADWNPSEPHKMHYPQLPDPCGWDVCASCQFLADDFQCSETSPITDIHFWISWLSDEIGQISNAYIGIHSDNLGAPGAALWTWHGQGNMKIRRYGQGLQGWVCPSANWIVPNNHIYFDQVNITDINDPITQERSKIYWLVIKLVSTTGSVPGWKTSRNDPPGPLFGKPAMWSLDMLNWQPINTGMTALVLHDMAFVITGQPPQPKLEFGDAPEGTSAIAYPATGVPGSFPTCTTIGPSGWIQHGNFGARFGPSVDFEWDGNAGLCPALLCFPPYDVDECFSDGDAGLIVPEAFTIDSSINVVPCPQCNGSSLGTAGQMAWWGSSIDIEVHNNMSSGTAAYVNLLIDWDQDGKWGGTTATPEHVLVNFPVPNGYDGPLSGLMLPPPMPGFLIGPNPGYVWARFSITEQQIPPSKSGWDGSGTFEDGETEDYLLRIDEPMPTMDFGDAPDPNFPTFLGSDGARHTVTNAILMGITIDAEFDGQPNNTATGDDQAGFIDDEDGVTFISGLVPGQWATVNVDLTNCAPVFTLYLNAWIDFDDDGSWSQLGDQIFDDVFVTPGIVNSLTFVVPFWAGPNITTYSRFRLSTAPGLSYTGYASNGEVEDHTVDISINPKIKWIQPPDRTPNGIDIKIGRSSRIADDFKCTTTGYITDIHFWGSWKYDEVGQINSVIVKIYNDDPVGTDGSDPCNTYSMPDELCWQREFLSDQFSMRPETGESADGEYWWDPVTGQLIPSGDRQIWRVDMELPWCQSFMQEGSTSMPVIYWLCIEVNTAFGEFGWKTRKWPDHFMDDACFSAGSELPYFWKELRYPPGHPYHGLEEDSIDMAFILTGIEPKPPTPHLKWSQPPLEIDLTNEWPFYCGWNEPSWTQHPDRPLIGVVAADDFRCIGKMPITSVHWWGSYQGWLDTQLPAPQPMAWLISFWTNAPFMPPGFSHPGQLLQRIWIPADRVKTEWVGTDHFPMSMPESCFQYNVEFYETEYFWQDKFSSQTFDNVYWISIKAIYPGDVVVSNPWGWKTRPAHWMDDAVRMECLDSTPPGQLVCDYWPLEDPTTGESFDLAFELDTDPNWIKWEQPFTGLRNWKHYEDQLSMANINTAGDITYTQIVADDWLCTKRTPVTEIVWWGSYLEYRYQPCGSGTPQPPPVKPDAFLISIWTDVPANPDGTNPFSHPGRKIWEYMAYNYDEVLVGCDKYPEGSAGPREPVYRYSVRLPGERWFRQRKINQIYWISIVAVYQATSDPTYKWGWTNHKHVFQDDAVAGIVLAGSTGWDWRVLYDQTGNSADQSFVLFTDPGVCVSCPDYDWNDIVNFKDFADFADQWMWLGLPGGFSDSDLNCDGAVDCEDLKILCDLWLVSCPLPTP